MGAERAAAWSEDAIVRSSCRMQMIRSGRENILQSYFPRVVVLLRRGHFRGPQRRPGVKEPRIISLSGPLSDSSHHHPQGLRPVGSARVLLRPSRLLRDDAHIENGPDIVFRKMKKMENVCSRSS